MTVRDNRRQVIFGPTGTGVEIQIHGIDIRGFTLLDPLGDVGVIVRIIKDPQAG